MEPIISPWTIYLINLTYNISQLLLVISKMCLIFSVAATLILIFSYCDYGYEEKLCNKCIKFLKYSIPIMFITATINTFIPSRDVMIAMVVSSYITPDNLYGANEAIKANLQDYINIIVNGIKDVK